MAAARHPCGECPKARIGSPVPPLEIDQNALSNGRLGREGRRVGHMGAQRAVHVDQREGCVGRVDFVQNINAGPVLDPRGIRGFEDEFDIASARRGAGVEVVSAQIDDSMGRGYPFVSVQPRLTIAIGRAEREGSPHGISIIDRREQNLHAVACIDVLRARADRDVAVREHVFDGVIGLFGIAKIVDQARAEHPVAIVERVDADARDVGIDPTGFGHEFVAGGVDILTGFDKSAKIGKDPIRARFGKDREIGTVQTLVHAVIRGDRIAFFFVLVEIGLEVRDAAVTEFRNIGQQIRLNFAVGKLAEGQPQAFAFGFGFAQREQVVVIFLRHGRAGIVVDIVDGGRFAGAGQINAAPVGKTACFVDDQARGVQFAHLEGDAVFEAFEAVAQDFVEHFPHRNAGVVAVAFDHFDGFVFNAPPGVGRDLRPMAHALDRKRAHEQDAQFIGEVVHDFGLGLAPRADRVEVAVFDEGKFPFEQREVSRIGEGMGVKRLVERGFENEFFAVEVKVLAPCRERAKAKARVLAVRWRVPKRDGRRRHVEVGIVEIPELVGVNREGLRVLRAARGEDQGFLCRSDRRAFAKRGDAPLDLGGLDARIPILKCAGEGRVARGDVGGDKRIRDKNRARGDEGDGLPDAPCDGPAPVRHVVAAQAVNDHIAGDDRRDHAHGDEIFAFGEQVADFQLKPRIAPFVRARGLAIDPDFGAVVDRLKANANRFVAPVLGKREGFAAPRHALVVPHKFFQTRGHGDLGDVRVAVKIFPALPVALLALVVAVEDGGPRAVEGEDFFHVMAPVRPSR